MMQDESYDVAVIGGGPAGLSAALSAYRAHARVVLIEREAKPGGILKQCIHDGFGLVRFGEKLAGCEYAQRFIDELQDTDITVALSCFVTQIAKEGAGFCLTASAATGMRCMHVKTLVLATGCRERTARQIAVHGTRPAGIFTAGSAQYYTNILGKLPTRRCVILGSGDIGLIMARRLTLEGAKVVGVYEAKSTPSGLARNLYQCLDDFAIPLHTSHTVTRVFGAQRVEAVEICKVDDAMRPILGTEERVECDALILSVGLIPENELACALDVPLDAHTKGPIVDQNAMTLCNNIFVCGNALHVNDLVDYVSESGEAAGAAAAKAAFAQGSAEAQGAKRTLAEVQCDGAFLTLVPQRVDIQTLTKETVFYFRAREEREKTCLTVLANGKIIAKKTYRQLRPPEMERVALDLTQCGLSAESKLEWRLTAAES